MVPDTFSDNWNQWKEKVTAYLIPYALDIGHFITVGRNEGIAESQIHQFVTKVLERSIKEGDFGLAYIIIKDTGIGFEKRKEVWELNYNKLMNAKNSNNLNGAMIVASELWGEESPQYQSAKERFEQIKKKEEVKEAQEEAKEKERREKRRLARAQRRKSTPAKIEVMRLESRRWRQFIEELEDDLAENKCADDFAITRKILSGMGMVDVESSIEFFQEEGVHCDCEIIYNLNSY